MLPLPKLILPNFRIGKRHCLPLVTNRSLAAVLLAALPLCTPLLLLARQQEYGLNPREYSKSITAEALSQGRGAPLTGTSGYLAGMVASAAGGVHSGVTNGDLSAQTRTATPSVESLLPSLPFALADGSLTGALSPEKASMHYRGKESIATLALGLGYFKPEIGSALAGGELELATMLGKQSAIGSTIALFSERRDLVVNGIWQLPDSGFRFKASGGYLWGNQNFNFPSGEANIDLGQFSYSLATQYILNKSGEAGTLQSVGLSAWGAQASQKSTADGPRLFMQETATDYLVMDDPLKLSEGRLLGAAADAQVALYSSLVVKGSLGYEQIRYPFSDGTRELSQSLYYSVDLFSEPFSSLFFGAGYRSGAGENRLSVTAETGNWQLSAFHNKGQQGVADNNGMMLTCRIALPAGKQKSSLAQRMKPIRSSNTANLLADALLRPAQLPHSFLAKVDPTAVTLAATISKTKLPGGATVNSEGDVFITVGSGSPAIIGVTRNGSPYDYAALVTTTPAQVVIHTRQFPEPTDTSDIWEISVKDGSSLDYIVTVKINK
jgi:hypothetical protein